MKRSSYYVIIPPNGLRSWEKALQAAQPAQLNSSLEEGVHYTKLDSITFSSGKTVWAFVPNSEEVVEAFIDLATELDFPFRKTDTSKTLRRV